MNIDLRANRISTAQRLRILDILRNTDIPAEDCLRIVDEIADVLVACTSPRPSSGPLHRQDVVG